jgi:acetylornithine deacetylase/succinyl-diaminopimelate desuccinylase-like protein
MDASGRPMISLGMKGLIYVELRCRKLNMDVHSSRAPLLPSASWRLVKALNELTDAEGRIAIPGWRQGVRGPGDPDLKLLKGIPVDAERVKKEFGVSELLHGKAGLEALRDLLYEPTCNIAGLKAGYQGEGSKTVLPAEARAKMDLRLVYDQSAERCLKLLRRHLKGRGFGDVEVAVLSKIDPSHTPADAPIAKAAAGAARAVYGQEAVIYPKHHASGPDCLFTKNLGLHSVWTGCAPEAGRAHAPNEFIGLDDYRLGMLYACELIKRFARS